MFPAHLRAKNWPAFVEQYEPTLQIEQGDPLIPTFAFRKLSSSEGKLNIFEYKRLIVNHENLPWNFAVLTLLYLIYLIESPCVMCFVHFVPISRSVGEEQW